MKQDGELSRLEQVVGKLLDSHQSLQRRCQDLEAALQEKTQTCNDLEQHIAQLTGERTHVVNRVQGLLERIDRWQEENVLDQTAGNEESSQGKLFALSS